MEIKYKTEQVKEELEEDLKELLEKYGYKLMGSGYNIKTKERDISYEG